MLTDYGILRATHTFGGRQTQVGYLHALSTSEVTSNVGKDRTLAHPERPRRAAKHPTELPQYRFGRNLLSNFLFRSCVAWDLWLPLVLSLMVILDSVEAEPWGDGNIWVPRAIHGAVSAGDAVAQLCGSNCSLLSDIAQSLW